MSKDFNYKTDNFSLHNNNKMCQAANLVQRLASYNE